MSHIFFGMTVKLLYVKIYINVKVSFRLYMSKYNTYLPYESYCQRPSVDYQEMLDFKEFIFYGLKEAYKQIIVKWTIWQALLGRRKQQERDNVWQWNSQKCHFNWIWKTVSNKKGSERKMSWEDGLVDIRLAS